MANLLSQSVKQLQQMQMILQKLLKMETAKLKIKQWKT